MKPREAQRHCGWVLVLIQVYWLGNQPRRHRGPGVTHLPVRMTILVGYPGQHNSKSTALLPLCFFFSPQNIVWIQLTTRNECTSESQVTFQELCFLISNVLFLWLFQHLWNQDVKLIRIFNVAVFPTPKVLLNWWADHIAAESWRVIVFFF